MSLVKVNSVLQVHQIHIQSLVPGTPDAGETGLITIVNSDGTRIEVVFTGGASNQVTGDNMVSALQARAAFNETYTVVDQGGGTLHVTQKDATGAFTMTVTELTGSLAVVAGTIQAPEFTPIRYKMLLASPIAASAADVYVSRETQRGKAGRYAVAVDATLGNTPFIIVEDTNSLLAPIAGPSAASEDSGFMDTGAITPECGPDWARELLTEEAAANPAVVTKVVEVSEANYLVLEGDTHVLMSTTTGAARTVTLAGGTHGQEVLVIQVLRDSTGNITVADSETATQLGAVGDWARFMYTSTDDKWHRIGFKITG